jgi:ribosomal protein L11 methyltransferase
LTSRWNVLKAVVPDALDDEIAAVLGSGSLGVEVAPRGPGASEVRVYLGVTDDAEAWRERGRQVLAAHGLADAASRLAIDSVEDGRWVERWQESLAALPLGDRFVVIPSERVAAPEGREPIRLIPGMAFGTGEHPTTRLCAAGLERHVTAGSRWLDLGTGTGLLAIVAARCGASRVLAIDNDGQAVSVAAGVIAENGAANVVEVREGSIGDRRDERFDGIVANIQSSFFLAHAAELAAALNDRGVLLASGLLDEDVPEVSQALESAELNLAAQLSDGPWAFLVANREGALPFFAAKRYPGSFAKKREASPLRTTR